MVEKINRCKGTEINLLCIGVARFGNTFQKTYFEPQPLYGAEFNHHFQMLKTNELLICCNLDYLDSKFINQIS